MLKELVQVERSDDLDHYENHKNGECGECQTFLIRLERALNEM